MWPPGCNQMPMRLCRCSTTPRVPDRKSTRLNSSHVSISYAVFCLKKKNSRRQTVREFGADGDRAWITVAYEGVLAADLGPELRAGDTLLLTGRSTFALRVGSMVEL